MRHLIDSYIQAGESEKVSAFADLSLVELIVERGVEAVNALPAAIRKNKQAAAETIENNVRRLILDESPINPKYYEKMSELLDALIAQRRQDALDYQKYLQKIVELTHRAKHGPDAGTYPKSLDSPAKRALFDNLDKDEALALTVDRAVRGNPQDGWRGNKMKTRKVWLAIREVLPGLDERMVLRNRKVMEIHARPQGGTGHRERVLLRSYRERLRELALPLVAKWEGKLGVQVAAWGIKAMKTKWKWSY